MTTQVKNTILQEIAKAGVLVVVLSTGLYFFYEDNKRHQVNVEKRLDRVEQRLNECNDKNVEILQDQVNKSNQLLKSIKNLIERSTCEKIKKAFIIGHHEKSKGAYSDHLKTSEYDFYMSMKKDLEKIGDVYTHDSNVKGYTNRVKDTVSKIDKRYDLIIALHFNSVPDESVGGCEAFYWHTNEKGEYYARLFCDSMERDMDYNNRGNKKMKSSNQRGFSEIYYPKDTTVLIEPFFGSNEEDCKKFDKDKFIEIISCLQ